MCVCVLHCMCVALHCAALQCISCVLLHCMKSILWGSVLHWK
jgi:hypothetical protein